MGESPAVADPTSPEAVALRAFGAKLRAVRHERGLTQEVMAPAGRVALDLHRPDRAGKRNVGVLNAIRLADALEVSPAVLVDGLTIRLP